jgi:hypothetical protein
VPGQLQVSPRTLSSTGHRRLQQHQAQLMVIAQAQHTTARIDKEGFAAGCVLWWRAKVPPPVPVHGLAGRKTRMPCL